MGDHPRLERRVCQDQRHVQHRIEEPIAVSLAEGQARMVVQSLSVVGRRDDEGVAKPAVRAHRLQQPADLRVREANLGVVGSVRSLR